jgi:mycofactocin precursor
MEMLVSSNSTVLVAEPEKSAQEPLVELPLVLEEIHLEKVTIDGICGVY